MSEFIPDSNPVGFGAFDCILTAPSASAALVTPALSPTRGSRIGVGEGALEVVVAQAKAVARRQVATMRAAIDLSDVIMVLVVLWFR